LLAVLTACGYIQNAGPQATPASPVVEPTKTLIPTRSAANSIPMPYPVVMFLTTRAGQELQFRSIIIGPYDYVAYHTEANPQGIPMENGVEISFDYITQVDFDLPSPDWDATPTSGNGPANASSTDSSGKIVLPDSPTGSGTWPVTVTLTDGSKITGSLGFKAHHQLHVLGESHYGNIDMSLVDVQKIVMKRTSAPAPIPPEPLGDDIIFVETVKGETIKVAYPRIFSLCMFDVYCCHGETIGDIPIQGGADIPLNTIKSVAFSEPGSVTVTMPDGALSKAKLRPPTDCPNSAWRLRGKAALGDFSILFSSIKKIER